MIDFTRARQGRTKGRMWPTSRSSPESALWLHPCILFLCAFKRRHFMLKTKAMPFICGRTSYQQRNTWVVCLKNQSEMATVKGKFNNHVLKFGDTCSICPLSSRLLSLWAIQFVGHRYSQCFKPYAVAEIR